MRCKACGANNEDYLEYCEKCAAPLTEAAAAAAASQPGNTAGRGFVRSPVWVKPEFNANTISETDIPSDFINAAQPAAGTAAPVQSAAPAPEPVVAAPVYGGAFCPKCGARLIEGQRFCNSCGARTDAAVSAPAAASVASSAWTGSPVSAAPAAPTIKYADPIDENMFSYNRTDDEDDGYAAARPAKRGAKSPAARPAPKARPARGGTRSPSRKRSPGINTKLIAMIGGGVVVLGLIVFGVITLINGGLFSSSAITKEPVIEQTTTSTGETAYNITVYAKKGSTVRFEGGSIIKEIPVSGKSVTYSIPEQVWVPGEPVEGTSLEIYPNISVINKKGESEAVTFPSPITVSIPSIDMTVTSPNTAQFSTASPAVDIAGIVGDTTAAIFVNDEQVPVDETGSFAYTYTMTQTGANTITVEARKNGYAIARSTFAVDYTADAPAATTTPGGSTAAPSDTSAAKSIYYATTADVNVRTTPSATGDKAGTLAVCDKVYVISADSNDWYKIVYGSGEAYVSGAYIKKVSDVSAYAPTTATINGDDINARAAAATTGDKVTSLANGTSVSLINQDANGWSMIEYNGKILFVSSQYIKK